MVLVEHALYHYIEIGLCRICIRLLYLLQQMMYQQTILNSLVGKIHEIHKHLLEYNKIEQKTQEKTLS